MSIIKKGDLTKRGGGFPFNWQERTFALSATEISYFAKTVKKGSCVISKTSVVEATESEKPKSFRLSNPAEESTGNTLFMCGASDAERDEWIDAISKVIADLNGIGSSSSAKVAAPEPVAEPVKAPEPVKVVPEPVKAAEPKPEPKPEPKEEPKPEPKPEPKKEEPKKVEPKKEEKKEIKKEEPKKAVKKSEKEDNANGMSPDEFADTLGLGPKSLMETQGKVLLDKFPEFIEAMNEKEGVTIGTKYQIASQFAMWCSIVPVAKTSKKMKEHHVALFDVVFNLCTQPDDFPEEGSKGSYKGLTACGESIAKGLGTVCTMDTSQKMGILLAPLAFNLIEKIMNENPTFEEKNAFVKEGPTTCRTEAIFYLLRMLPHSGNLKIPNGMTLISRILLGDEYPDRMKKTCSQVVTTMTQVNKACMKDAGPALMDLIATGDYDNLIFSFATSPEIYTSNPGAVHKQLDYLMTMPFNHVAALLHAISGKHPAVLVPHLDKLLENLEENVQMGAMILMMIKGVASAAPNDVYQKLDKIVASGEAVTNADAAMAGIIGNCGKATKPAKVADLLLFKLMEGLKACKDTTYVPSWLNEISNIKSNLSDKSLLKPHMEEILKHKKSSEIIVGAIEDFAAGRSLAIVTKKVDELEAKVMALNNKVAESCANFEDVKAYVDKNINEVKDFVGEVVKKLPLPKRLEVVGTMRKTLILHFECCKTKKEFPIQSHEWSKWLKMGFSMASAGKAIIDVGTGNPLGLLTTGVGAVKGIYEAYKSNDDDEFNTYITNPFLTSSESDGLIIKLREQDFFAKFSYDARAPGWYLNNPKKDGVAPGAAAGSVTKVASKAGHGIGETVKAAATEIAPDAVGLAGDLKDTAEIAEDVGCKCIIA